MRVGTKTITSLALTAAAARQRPGDAGLAGLLRREQDAGQEQGRHGD